MVIPPLGSLRHFITFESIDEDSPNAEWKPNGITAMASIMPVSGRDLQTSVQVQASITHKIEMLYQPGPKPDMRINFQGRIFSITQILNIEERNRVLDIMAEEAIPA